VSQQKVGVNLSRRCLYFLLLWICLFSECSHHWSYLGEDFGHPSSLQLNCIATSLFQSLFLLVLQCIYPHEQTKGT